MSLWEKGADAATNKPKNLSTNENSQYKKQDVYATNSGWVQRAGTKASGSDNANAQPEVLVAIRGLAGTSASTGLQEATITNVRFTWDEAVTVTGAPVMKVVNSGGGTHDCVYTATGSTANRKRFTVASQTLAANQVLSLGTALHDAVTLPGGATIKDTASGTINSQRTIAAGIRVTHTVTA
jgi:hypothetical protein